jgi:hypothetical protein
MHHENHFSGLFMQNCRHALLVVAEKDCDACTAETHLRILLVKILQQGGEERKKKKTGI